MGKVLAVGEPRVVEVDVHIDHGGQDQHPGRVDDALSRVERPSGGHSRDFAVRDADVGLDEP